MTGPDSHTSAAPAGLVSGALRSRLHNECTVKTVQTESSAKQTAPSGKCSHPASRHGLDKREALVDT